jgi:DNA-directed RNA polymerase subunit RPC12/RpoP
MTSSAESDLVKCPDCRATMRLSRVLPTSLPKQCAPQIRVFVCMSCGTIVTQTIHAKRTAAQLRR